MRNAVVVSLDLDANASTPHGIAPVQASDCLLQGYPQAPDSLLGVDRNRVTTVWVRVERVYHGFHGGSVKCGHVGVSVGSAAMIVATPANSARVGPVKATETHLLHAPVRRRPTRDVRF